MDDKILASGKTNPKLILFYQLSLLVLCGLSFICLLRTGINPMNLAYIMIYLSLALIILLCYLEVAKCELIITENYIRGKSCWGREVVLPIHMITSYTKIRRGRYLAISTPSGEVRFGYLEQAEWLLSVLAQVIIKRHEKANAPVKAASEPQKSTFDELKKLKELLDCGIITQEEFEAKKKQILGL